MGKESNIQHGFEISWIFTRNLHAEGCTKLHTIKCPIIFTIEYDESRGTKPAQSGTVVQKNLFSTQEKISLNWWKTIPDLLWTEWDWKWQFAPRLSSTPEIVTKLTSLNNSTEDHSFSPIQSHFQECYVDSWPLAKTLLFHIFLNFFCKNNWTPVIVYAYPWFWSSILPGKKVWTLSESKNNSHGSSDTYCGFSTCNATTTLHSQSNSYLFFN